MCEALAFNCCISSALPSASLNTVTADGTSLSSSSSASSPALYETDARGIHNQQGACRHLPNRSRDTQFGTNSRSRPCAAATAGASAAQQPTATGLVLHRFVENHVQRCSRSGYRSKERLHRSNMRIISTVRQKFTIGFDERIIRIAVEYLNGGYPRIGGKNSSMPICAMKGFPTRKVVPSF